VNVVKRRLVMPEAEVVDGQAENLHDFLGQLRIGQHVLQLGGGDAGEVNLAVLVEGVDRARVFHVDVHKALDVAGTLQVGRQKRVADQHLADAALPLIQDERAIGDDVAGPGPRAAAHRLAELLNDLAGDGAQHPHAAHREEIPDGAGEGDLERGVIRR